ncbi:MAG TPA: TetR/AcrR family transcriptional regulator [Aggregatilineales bacterium]|nr:TetR/AcrR family transcriptional regulator [Anaerolineales bacterium]HRE48831.1 TetR/AcrR family transcriptional regulator [Aggregatilineales bacterium]
MPYPSQVNAAQIIQKAAEMIALEGSQALSLAHLAAGLGIKAPSLYRYFPSKDTLLKAVNTATLSALFEALMKPLDEGQPPPETMLSVARAQRRFAHANPLLYHMAFSANAPDTQIDAAAAEQGALPLQACIAQISGEADSLSALRGLLSLLHGFISLELAGQFRRGGDLDQAFEFAVQTYLIGVAKA